jgi:hypothetical protein
MGGIVKRSPFVVCPQGHIESNTLRRHYKQGRRL